MSQHSLENAQGEHVPGTNTQGTNRQDTGRLLDVHQLSVSFGHGAAETQAVKNLSLTIDSGETVALVGESGSGKSVTALSMIQLLPYPLAHHPTGSILYLSLIHI